MRLLRGVYPERSRRARNDKGISHNKSYDQKRQDTLFLSLRGLQSRPWQSHLLHFRLLRYARNDEN